MGRPDDTDAPDGERQDGDRAQGWSEKITRSSIWVLGGSLAALLVTGVPLIWLYRPQRQLWLQDLHTVASLVFVVAALLLMGTAVVARARRRPSRVGWLAAVALFLLSQVGGTSGLALAWDQLLLDLERASQPQLNGILTALQPEVRRVFADGHVLTQSSYQMIAVVHIVMVPLAAVATYALSRRRRHDPATTAPQAPSPPPNLT